jgi:hypothetical protein
MNINEITELFDDYLMSTGKKFIELRAANDLLKSKNPQLKIDLKILLEKNEIPHAFQTETKPRQWRIPFSNQSAYKEKRSEFLKHNPQTQTATIANNSSKNFGVKIIIFTVIICFLYNFLTSDSSSSSENAASDSKYYINSEAFCTYNKSDFDDMYSYLVKNDLAAVDVMRNNEQILVLPKGTLVYLVDASLGYDIIRLEGSTQKLWIAMERLSKH